MEAKKILAKISEKWFMYEPLLFEVLCSHALEEKQSLLTMFRTGKRKIQFNPEFVEVSSPDDVEEKLIIEVLRIILKHPYERQPENPVLAALTKASDVTISDSVDCVFSTLDKPSFFNLEEGKCYEEYYNKLKFICPSNQELGEEAARKLFRSMEKGKENSGARNITEIIKNANSYESAAQQSELWDEDAEMVEHINSQITKANASNQWGSIAGNLKETIISSMKIPMDYRKILSNFHASMLSQRRKLTRMHPNRRYGYDFMGSKYEPKTKLLVAVDVSGSISKDDLNTFFSIINRFFSYGIDSIEVVTFDTQIHDRISFPKARKSVKITGRGGTYFQPAVDLYEKEKQFDGMIIFTDGYADVPYKRTNKKILWILSNKENYENAKDWIHGLKNCKSTWIPL